MKTLLIVVFAFSLPAASNSSVSVSPLPVIAVNNTVFDAFHAHKKHNSVALAWTTVGGGISSFIIQHSFDGVSFTTVDQVSPEASGWNNYVHDGALPGFNHYRIGAIMSDVTTEYSDVEVVRIVSRK